MAENKGNQIITFQYQQQGTAKSFNNLLYKVIPNGIINRGRIRYGDDNDENNLLFKISNSIVQIKCTPENPLNMIMSDSLSQITAHIIIQGEPSENNQGVNVNVNKNEPYIVAIFNWNESANSYVEFYSKSYSDIINISGTEILGNQNNMIIIGKCEYNGDDLTGFDYTKTTWSPLHWNNDFMIPNSELNSKVNSPNFLVSYNNDNDNTDSLSFIVGQGKAIINGKFIEKTSDSIITLNNTAGNDLYINTYVTNGRKDLLIIKYEFINGADSFGFEYIMGSDSLTPRIPICPSYGLPIAVFTYGSGNITNIKGSNIKYIYNNNYISSSPVIKQIALQNNEVENVLVI